MAEGPSTASAFISYAHDHQEHVDQVRAFWKFLRSCGIDGQLDLPAGERRQDWALWMLRGIRDSRHVLVVASPEYKRRAEGDAPAGEGMGVRWEALLLRNLVYEDPVAALDRIIPVVLPGGSPADLPVWLGGRSHAHYPVEEFTVAGGEKLLRLLTDQPYETVPPLGRVPRLPPREQTEGETVRPSLVLPPAVVESTPVPPPQPPPTTFSFPDAQALTGALFACKALHQLAVRHELLDLMGEILGLGHAFPVAESPDARTHLRALVRRSGRTLARDATLKAMYIALAEIAPDDTGTEGVRAQLVAAGLALGEE
ncbi:SEFIR domain-containing protein [Streptomyces sp. NPDC090798]|uniref:SEFIR domain-containing protein n=1 Tax=Streptomyces sp. NPDC090798 TaxID=3365968 RepID=UPI00380ED560